jgi:hypothetical protein
MKRKLILGIIFISLSALAFQGWVIYSSNVEEQPYQILRRYGEIEIRHYPVVRMISYRSASRNNGFGVLAGYIFGGNEDEMKIEMTAPVHMSNTDKGAVMSFVLPQEHLERDLPKPNNQAVIIHYTKAKNVAAIQFSGYVNSKIFEDKKSELIHQLDSLSIEYGSDFTLLGYDPPYKVNDRRNEIIVSIDKETLP